MYAYLKGKLEDVSPDNIVIEVSGIGYNVKVSEGTVSRLPQQGSEIKMYTYTLVREDALQLYGFLTREDLQIFKLLISVNGIGPKGGLAILSVMDADTLRFAILSGDAKTIASAPGIGKKTAERVILDLKDKISLSESLRDMGGSDPASGISESDAAGQMKQEAVEALVALGYSATEATAAVSKVQTDTIASAEELLKAALKHMF